MRLLTRHRSRRHPDVVGARRIRLGCGARPQWRRRLSRSDGWRGCSRSRRCSRRSWSLRRSGSARPLWRDGLSRADHSLSWRRLLPRRHHGRYARSRRRRRGRRGGWRRCRRGSRILCLCRSELQLLSIALLLPVWLVLLLLSAAIGLTQTQAKQNFGAWCSKKRENHLDRFARTN